MEIVESTYIDGFANYFERSCFKIQLCYALLVVGIRPSAQKCFV